MRQKAIPFLFCMCLAGFAFVSISTKSNITFLSRGRAIDIISSQKPIPQPTPCLLIDKIIESDPDFDNIDLTVGDKDISYFEERYLRDSSGNMIFDTNGQVKKEGIVKNDPEREIALKLLNLKTCTTQIIKIKKRGGILVAPNGYEIEVYQRLSGLTWNAHNTYYSVKNPTDTIVIRNVWPDIKYENHYINITEKGRKKRKLVRVPVFDKNKAYVPYSDNLRTNETIQKGIDDLKNIVTQAKKRLRDNNVISHAFPNKLVADIFPDNYYWRRPIIEQSDLGEFVIDPQNTIDRVFVILATNGSTAWSMCNFASACGLYQFTGGTYGTLVRKYSEANLIKDFKVGSVDHINSAMAAILLDDDNLTDLIKKYGIKIYSDPNRHEYIYAGYNGNPKWVFKSLNATLFKGIEWTKHLKSETKGAMFKLRYLDNNNIPL